MNTLTISGSSIVVRNGKCTVDGVDVSSELANLTIVVTGNVESLDVAACNKITVDGKVHKINTGSGDVSVSKDIFGSVKSMSGDVKCTNIGGDVQTMSGDVDAKGTITGSVKTMSGDISKGA